MSSGPTAESNVARLNTRLDRLWRNYCAARDIAERSHKIEDGISAGRLWACWLDEFVKPEQRMTPKSPARKAR